jgi:hypothetical protein
MKRCLKCDQTYTDETLNFCLNDGEMLVQTFEESRPFDDAPPTVLMNDARATNPSNWQPPAAPPAVWQGQRPMRYPMAMSPNQTLAIVSLCLGVASMTIGWCCYIGVLLSPAAIITGYIALGQVKRDPVSYTGRGLAIGGIATGAAYIGIMVLVVLFFILASILGK